MEFEGKDMKVHRKLGEAGFLKIKVYAQG